MEIHLLISFTLVLVLTSIAQSLDYSPCYYGPFNEYSNAIYCHNQVASEVLAAFRRNENNSVIDSLYLENMDDMTDDVLDEILDIVAASASANVGVMFLLYLAKVERVPEAVRKFTHLPKFYFTSDDALKVLPSGSMVFGSDKLEHVFCLGNRNLKVIEPGAFQGNFNDTLIYLNDNNLQQFDEAVFKPLLSSSTAKIYIYNNPFVCDCSLAWIIRDNRQYFPRAIGQCRNTDGNRVYFDEVDVDILAHC